MKSMILCAALGATALAFADDGAWPVKFTEQSSKDLVALHEELLAQRLDGVKGIPVSDAVWKTDAIEVRIKSGTVFLEPPVRGAAVGAFFVGDATAHFTPVADEQRRELQFWLGRPSLDEPITSAYFFTLTGSDLLAQLGTTAAPSVVFDAVKPYADVKQALRQRGLDTVEAFLDREGPAKGTALALVAAPGIRIDASKTALLLLRQDPTRQEETGLEVYGHAALASSNPLKFLFRTISEQQAASPLFQPQATDVAYGLDLSLGQGMDSAAQSATITLKPAPGLRALRLGLTPYLRVESVRLADRELPFAQWKRDASGMNFDESVVVDLGAVPAAGSLKIDVKSSGGLFEPFGDAFYLVDEDLWYPAISDARAAAYELRVTLPNDRTVVAPGLLVEQKDDGEKKHYVFRTSRPQKASSLYIGRFQSKEGAADDTKIEVYVGRSEKNLSFAVVEMQNILKVYNRLFIPLELKTLRVASAPTAHGRGFDGLLLLSEGGGFGGDSSGNDIFRAHEVAHQWWGNVVQPDRWPRDRWLSESFAEYASMEYFRARFEDPKKTRDTIKGAWIDPLLLSPRSASSNLRGEARTTSIAELWSLLDGGENVYTKGPMVLQMLRYLSSVKTGGDDTFWEIWRTFLKEYSGKSATSEDFVAVSQRVLGTDLRWFWSQWLLRTEIPTVRWTQRVEPKDGKFLLTVEAQQMDTDFTLLIPVYAHFAGGGQASRPLIMKGKTGKLEVLLPQEPKDVTLNDNWEALVKLERGRRP